LGAIAPHSARRITKHGHGPWLMGMCPWPPSEFQGNIIKSSSTIKKTILYDFVTQTIMILCPSPSSVAFLFSYARPCLVGEIFWEMIL